MEFKKLQSPEDLSKIHAEIKKILKFQKATRRKKRRIRTRRDFVANNE